jgi:uncharacterized protein DUF3303
MLFMIIERFKDNDMLPIYKRVRDEGRMFPAGLRYVDSGSNRISAAAFNWWNAMTCACFSGGF